MLIFSFVTRVLIRTIVILLTLFSSSIPGVSYKINLFDVKIRSSDENSFAGRVERL